MGSYLELLDLEREPFSNSPDPDAYYRTPTHEDCLNRLEIAIRLRRGLNVVLGEVGTGKSTLCRCLLRNLNEREGVDVFLLLDAGCETGEDFVRNLCGLLVGEHVPAGLSRRECIGLIQSRVFESALERSRNPVLFVDEGQKLSPAALEVLRELLNFETNTEKLLQIVIFGQPELAQIIEGMPNFKDRINECLYLKPLSMRESIRLVRHRLRLAGGQKAERLFSTGSLMALHRASGGKPRQLMRLGHQMLLALLVGNRRIVTRGMVRAQVARNRDIPAVHWGKWLVVAVALSCVAGGYFWMPEAVKGDARIRLEAAASRICGWFPGAEVLDKPVEVNLPESPAMAPPQGLSASGIASGTGVAPVPPPVSGAAGAASETKPTAKMAGLPVRQEAVPEAPAIRPENAVPDSLGTFRLPKGESLAGVVRAVYGSSSALRKVEAKNPGYRTDIDAGEQLISLPAVLYAPPPSMTRGMLLSLGTFEDPQTAYAAWRGYGKRSLSLELVPVWRPGEGVRFHILAPRSFSSERAAWSWLSRFSPPAGASVRLLPPFDGASLVFHKFTMNEDRK